MFPENAFYKAFLGLACYGKLWIKSAAEFDINVTSEENPKIGISSVFALRTFLRLTITGL